MLIGLTGNKGVGKDTVGQYLVDNYGFTRMGFADKLKEAVANLFNIKFEQVDHFKSVKVQCTVYEDIETDDEFKAGGYYEWSGYTWREFLQRFGTEMGRYTFGTNFWVDLWESQYTALSVMKPDEFRRVVVTDVRFENEAARILSSSGFIAEVIRSGHSPDGHASEAGLDEDLIDDLIINNGTVEELYQSVDRLMERITDGSINY